MPTKAQTDFAFHQLGQVLRDLEADLRWKLDGSVRIPAEWHDIAQSREQPLKSKITLRVDQDVARFFRAMGQGHLTRMNAVLRAFMLARLAEVVKAAKDHGCSIRIGVNAGSLEKHLLDKYGEPCPDAMVESGLDHIKLLQDNDFHEFKISVKASDVFLAAAAYQQLAEATDAPIHLGITEAGGLMSGTVKSAIGLGNLLWMGIGDTIRVSLSADPVEEVKVGFEILKSLGLRHRGVTIISCPSCARQGFDVIKTVSALEDRLSHITTSMSLSIIGCVVNGPGEALMTDIGFTGGGAGSGMVYLAGKQSHKLGNEAMVDHIVELVEKKAAEIEAAKEAAE